MTAVYAHALPVIQVVPFEDSSGNAITPSAASYRVLDEEGTEIVGATAASLDASSTSITVAAEDNTLADGQPLGYRTVEVTFTVAGNSVIVTPGYLLERSEILAVMTNSYQTYGEAEIIAQGIGDLVEWPGKTSRERRTALVHAYQRLGRVTYRITDRVTAQDRLNWGTDQTIYRINEFTAVEFQALKAEFRQAIKRAQITEADVILGGDRLENLRREGLMSSSVGESSQFFRPTKPVSLPVSERALRELQGYVRFASGGLARA